jgi:uncharacterized protein (DUF488 family)
MSNKITLMTIGFTKSTAEYFFDRLVRAGVKKIIDVRLHNTSQLAGFAKSDDLTYFLNKIGGIAYAHEPLLAPTEDMLKAFKKDKGDWAIYRDRFVALMAERRIQDKLYPDQLDGCCLLCSEAVPHHCHRRLVVEYLNERWNNCLSICHL